MTKYYKYPFAEAGTTASIPDVDPGDGTVSYQTGFGPDYSADPATNPSALFVPRAEFNDLMLDVTDNIQQYQQLAVPEFITSIDNLGSPFPYEAKARVRFFNAEGQWGIYESLKDNNTDVPEIAPLTPSKNWQEIAYKLTATDTGTVNNILAYTGASLQVSSFGVIFISRAAFTNTGGPMTIQLGNSEAVYPVKTCYNGVFIDPLAGMYVQASMHILIYSSGGYILANPYPVSAKAIVTQVTFSGTTSQTITGLSTNALIQFDHVDTDSMSSWNNTTKTILPTIAGKYDISAQVSASPISLSSQILAIRGYIGGVDIPIKAAVKRVFSASATDIWNISVNSIALNGTTDYIYATWSNSGIASTTIGDVGESYDGQYLCFLNLTFVGES